MVSTLFSINTGTGFLGVKYFGQFFEEQSVEYLNFNTQYFKAFTHDLNAYTDYDGHMNGDAAKEYSEVLAQVLESTGQKN